MRSSLEREITATPSSSLAMATFTNSSSSSSSSYPSLLPKKMKKKCNVVYRRRTPDVPMVTPSSSPSESTSPSSDSIVVVESPEKSEVISDCRSCCSSNIEMSTNGGLADPEVESAQKSSIYLQYRSEERRKIKVDSNSTVKISDQKSTVQIKMPSNDEIEQFFVAAEKNLHKRFTEKYNFDVVKDVPLEGRYEWVEIKP